MNDFTHLNDLLTADNRYDIALYAAQTGMDDPGGMWTPAYEAKVRAEVEHMEAHNAAQGEAATDNWLARFVGALAGIMIAALAGLLAR